MTRLLFAGFAHTTAYRGHRPGTAEVWAAGEERDVPDDTAEYLLREFPGAFLAAGGTLPLRAEVLHAPPADRALRSPTQGSRWGDGPLPDDSNVKPVPVRARGREGRG